MMKVVVDYPGFADELAVVHRSLVEPPELEPVVTAERLVRLQAEAAGVYVDPEVTTYAVTLVLATRHPGQHGLEHLDGYVAYGASPRGSIHLIHAARALALLRGRRYALPQDVRELAKDVLRFCLPVVYYLALGLNL